MRNRDLSIRAIRWWLAGALLVAAAPAGQAASREHRHLADAPANRHWHAPAETGEAIYAGDPEADGEPRIVLRKGPIGESPLTLRILSDARRCVISSGEAKLTVALRPDQVHRLVLDGDARRPSLRLDGRELARERGGWIRAFHREADDTVSLTFEGATYVNLAFGAGRSEPVFPEAERRGDGRDGEEGGGGEQEPDARATADHGSRRAGTRATVRRPTPGEHEDVLGPTNRWRFSFTAGGDYLTSYFYRGFGRDNDGLILQPWLDANLWLYRRQGRDLRWLDSVRLRGGFRSSHHWAEEAPIRAGGDERWAEFDWYGGVAVRVFERFDLTLDNSNVESIQTSFRDVHQINLGLAFDDRDPDYRWSLQPYALVSVEFEHQSDGGWLTAEASRSRDFSRGTYLELGLRPRFELFDLHLDEPVVLTTPLTVGLSLSDYYEDSTGRDRTFGYFDAGLDFAVPIASIPGDGGRRFLISANAGVHLLLLGDSARDLSRVIGTGGDRLEVIGRFGITLDY